MTTLAPNNKTIIISVDKIYKPNLKELIKKETSKYSEMG